MSLGCHHAGRELQPACFGHWRIADIECLVGRTFAIDPTVIQAPRRGGARAAFARQVAIYLAHIGLGLTLTEVAGFFGRDRTTVAHACRVVEKRRDDPEVDATIDMLERALGMISPAGTTRRDGWYR